MKTTKTKLFKTAWAIAVAFSMFGDALAHAWKVIKLAATARRGVVSFAYRKVSGEVRKAIGTLDFAYEAKGGRPASDGIFVYFDVEAGGVRSCKVENLIF